MTSHSDIDTLIAMLHPHVLINKSNDGIGLLGSLWPHKGAKNVRRVAQAFATLFGYHPGCDAAAVTFQTTQPNHTSVYISLSPHIPPTFDDNVNKWIAQFMALHEKPNTGSLERDRLSLSEKSFILHTYKVCYPQMRQTALSQGFGDWDVFIGSRAVIDEADLSSAKKEHVETLPIFSELVRRFAGYISRESLGKDDDVLQFHTLCMDIRDMMSNREFSTFLDEHIYCVGAKPAVSYFSPPLALSTLLTLSRSSKLTFGDHWSPTVLDSAKEVRKFRAVITESFLTEHFNKPAGIKWKEAEEAFLDFAERPHRYTGGNGYEWNATKKLLSTVRPITVHPEITLIQHLVDNKKGDIEAYIACSRTPCYASVVYAWAVNGALKTRFTMDIENSRWCQLYTAEPWILPGVTQPDVVKKMEEYLLQDLEMRINAWHRQRWADGLISSGQGDFNWECEGF